MALQCLVTNPGGVQTDLSNYVVQDQWRIQQQLGQQGDTATFYFYDEVPKVGQYHFTIQPLAQIVFKDTTLGVTLFGGVVTLPRLYYGGPTNVTWEVECRDYTIYADNSIVTLDLQNVTGDAAVKQATAQGTGGITTNHVQSAPMITRLRLTYQQLSALWTHIAMNVSTTSEYGWYVDENKDLHWFNARQVASSGITLTDAAVSDSTTSGHVDLDQSYYRWDGTSLRDRIYVRGARYTTTFTDTFVGNGYTSSFLLSFAPDPSQQAAALSLTVNGAAQTVILSQSSGQNTTGYQWVVQSNPGYGWMLQALSGTATPAAGAVMKLTYRATSVVTTQCDNTAAETKYGVFAMALEDTSIMDVSTAKMRSLRELQQYGNPIEEFDCVVPEQFPGHFRSGQVVDVTAAWIPDSQNNYTAGMTSIPFLVVNNEISGQKGALRQYHATMVRVGFGA